MLVLLKLGGSLITDKSRPYTAQQNIIKQAAREIKQALFEDPDLKLILGHGSGSFGHVSANRYNTFHGVFTNEDWSGFIKVWKDARELNQLVMEQLIAAGINSLCFPPSSQIVTSSHAIRKWDLHPIQSALANHILPVVYGDVVFDQKINGSILSTEDLFPTCRIR